MKETYNQLVDAINSVSTVIKFSKIDEIYPMLELMFSLEQAEVGSKMTPGPKTAEKMAEATGKSVEEVARILENMADNGTVYSSSSKEPATYALLPLLPGSWEIQLMKGETDEKSRKLAHSFEDYFKAAASTPGTAGRGMTTTTVPFSRVIPIAEELSPETEILPYEVLANYLEDIETVSVSHCYCRHEGALLEDPCEKPIENCFNFGPFAKFLAERGFGRLIEKAEAKKIMKEAEEAGLVHCSSNTTDTIGFVCNCCSCHCGIMKSMQTIGGIGMTAASDFIVKLDEDECSACEDCIDRCQVNAMSFGDDIVDINYQLCIGCGLCISTCPTESLSLVLREGKVVPPKDHRELAKVQFAAFEK
ncbi:MAG: 4Fe-4S dicluster domain-containing protein [Proteobacteria bacterium]|nr:4Fe-4S dicluster domain-containing protein [Pseudomonadota bacterium]